MEEALMIRLSDFEGPLDVLLHLIKETKMDIQEVPMLLIVDQYLQFIKSMQTMQLDLAGEYLVMAATLLEIKSRKLLPRVEVEVVEEEPIDPEDLEASLKQQLIEYQQFKDIAGLLRQKEEERDQFFGKEPSQLTALTDHVPLKEGELALEDVLKAFEKMFERLAKQEPLQARIERNDISVEETMVTIVDRLTHHRQEGLGLEDFVASKSSLIACFLAILELAKTKRVIFKQSQPYEPIRLFCGENFDQELEASVTSGV